jgi:hypothetical protein
MDRFDWLCAAGMLGLIVVIGSFNSTNSLSMSRHLGVRRLFLLDLTCQIFGLLVTIGCALLYPSVWALVLHSTAENLRQWSSACHQIGV